MHLPHHFLHLLHLLLLLSLLSIALPCTTAHPLSGCGKPLPPGQAAGQVSNGTVTSGGIARSYLIYVPRGYATHVRTSLILSFHGGTKTAGQQLELDGLAGGVFNQGQMVVYPQGVANTWQGVPNVTTNDIQFTIDLLNQLQGLYCIDSARIAATGKSDGAGLVNLLACDAAVSARVAAFAPVSGAYYVDTLPCAPTTVAMPCVPARRDVPMLAFHGGNDSTIAYAGGQRKNECLPAIPHFIREWAWRDGLGVRNVTEPLAANAVRYSYGAGRVELVYESDIGHDWPSTVPNADNSLPGHRLASYNATPLILDFFNRHPLFW